jgi:O-antigen/teichoic acid export membrane protein
LASFGAGLALHSPSFASLVFAYVSAHAVVAAASLWPLRSEILPPPRDRGRASPMIRYGFYSMGCGVGFFLTSTVQALLLNALLSTREVGIYAAHSLASVGLAMFAGSLFSTVFFPKASASTDRPRLWRGLWKAWLFALVPSFLAFTLAQGVVLVLMGRAAFTPEPRRIVLFALCSCVVLMQTSLGQVIGAEGVRGARLGLVMSLAMGGLSLSGSLVLIPHWGIEGAVAAMTVSYAVGLVWLGLAGRGYLHAEGAA